MPSYKCHNCGTVADWQEPTKEFVCQACGAVNVTPSGFGVSPGEDLGCIAPTGFEWTMPAGVIGNPIVGYKYKTAQGSAMTREEYFRAFGIDPKIALDYMRGKKDVPEGTARLGRFG